MSRAIPLRPQHSSRSNDCSVAAVRDAITAEFDAVPFLGELRCSHTSVIAGAVEEIVFTYTVGRSGIADSGWLKLCFRYYSDWDLQTADPAGRDYAGAQLVSRSLVGRASEAGAATVQQLAVRYDVKGGERPFQKSLLIHAVDGYLRPGDVIEIRLGDRRFGGPGTRVQTFVEDAFEVHLFVDPLGTSRMARAGVNQLAIVPGPPDQVVVRGPRLVRSDAGTVTLRAHLQDRWGNACADTAATLRAHIDGAAVAEAQTPSAGWASVSLEVPARRAHPGRRRNAPGGAARRDHRRRDRRPARPARVLHRPARPFQRHGRHAGHGLEPALCPRYRRARRCRLHRQRLSDHRRGPGSTSSPPAGPSRTTGAWSATRVSNGAAPLVSVVTTMSSFSATTPRWRAHWSGTRG